MLERKSRRNRVSRRRTLGTLDRVKGFMEVLNENALKRVLSTSEIEENSGRNKLELDEELPPAYSSVCWSISDYSEENVCVSIAAPDIQIVATGTVDMNERLLEATYCLFASEREYGWKLSTLTEALELLTSSKHKSIVDARLTAFSDHASSICACSIAVMSRLEKIITSWKSGSSVARLGAIFDDGIWERYENYHNDFQSVRPIIRFKRRHDRKLAAQCESFERIRLNGGRLESLLLLPEERIVAYNEHLEALVGCTPHDHPDYATAKEHKEHVEQRMLESRRGEIRAAQNELKLDEIECQFPVDRLDLVQSPSWLGSTVRRALGTNSGQTMNNMKQFVGRRKSIGASTSAPTWIRNSADNSSNAATKSTHTEFYGPEQHQRSIQHYYSTRMPGAGPNSSAACIYQHESSHHGHDSSHVLKQQQQPYSRKMETFVRVYMKEGRVILSTGVQSQERYLFLFSDLLLVAKENYRGINSYRLKEKIRLCEIWISDKGLEDVTESVRSPLNSFVIGWPTKSYVAEFKSAEERNAWYEILVSTVTSVKRKERPNSTTVNVKLKDGKIVKACSMSINNFQTAKELLSIALANFNVPSSSLNEYQLWVQSGRETAAYPLQGHEYPFAILLSHIRDLLPDADADVDVSLLNDLTAGGQGIKCNFVIKKKRGSKKNKTGQLVSHLKRKMKKQDSTDSACPPSPSGKLFGLPLDELTETQPVPKPILALLEHLAKEGSYMEGIFRKPPKTSTLRELKEKMDAGREVDLVGVPPSVSASLLKEFFRQLPEALLGNDKVREWESLCDEPNGQEKLQKAKLLASHLPPSNVTLLRYFLCLLHIISSRAAYNQMNSFNLAVCVAPSLTGSGNLSGTAAKRMIEIIQYLIDNMVELFGEETLTLLKGPDDQADQPPRPFGPLATMLPHNNADDYDALGHLKQETSSLDSLTATGSSPSCSRPQSSLHRAVNISRDSGLCEPQVNCEDMASSTSIQRCLSQNEDTEDDATGRTVPGLMARSTDDLTTGKTQNRRIRIISDPDGGATRDRDCQGDREDVVSREDGELRQHRINVDSTDSIYEPNSAPSLPNYYRTNGSTFRSSKRASSASLIRSASGDHLYLTERMPDDNDPAGTHNQCQSDQRLSSRPELDRSPLTVSLTAGDSSYGSSPVSPESNECNLDVQGAIGASPSPLSFMTRNSAYRKPARHRKCQGTAQSSSPTNVCVDDEEEEDAGSSKMEKQHCQRHYDPTVHSTDTSNDDEADSGVHVMEVHTAQPIIVSCNCESSNSISSDDEKPINSQSDERKSAATLCSVKPASPTPPAITLQPATPPSTVISEIYPLKSPCQRIWHSGATRFIVDSTPATSKLDSPVVRRHSARVYSNSGDRENSNRRSYDESASLTERVFRGLELMMEKVENAHISQEKLLRSRLSDSVNDSSTVTETSSEESTPHVSRESSSAHEYKKVARGMFDQANVENVKADCDASQYRSSRTLPIMRSVVQSANLVRPVSTVGGGGTRVIPTTPTMSERKFNRPPPVPVDWRQTCQFPTTLGNASGTPSPRYRACLVETSERSVTTRTVKTRYEYSGDSGQNELRTVGNSSNVEVKPGALSDEGERIVPLIPGQVRDRIQRYDRERLRRKTLGGLEFTNLANLAQQNSAPVQNERKSPRTDRVSRYEQHRAPTIRSHLVKTQNPQLPRSKSLDRKTMEVREEDGRDSANSEDEDRRRQDISWSVRRYVEMFDNAGKRISRGATNSRRSSEDRQDPLNQYQSEQQSQRRPNPALYRRQIVSEAMDENRRRSGFLTSGSVARCPQAPPAYSISTLGTAHHQNGNWHQSGYRRPDYSQQYGTTREQKTGNESYV